MKKTGSPMVRIFVCLLAFAMLLPLAACGGESDPTPTPTPTDEPTAEPTATEAPTDTPTPTAEEEKTKTAEEIMNALRLCVTDSDSTGITTTDIRSRFEDFKKMGITAVRIDGAWNYAGTNKYTLDGTTKIKLQQAKRLGLTVKLIVPTMMYTLDKDKDMRLVDSEGNRGINTISYWYGDLLTHTENTLRAKVKAVKDAELLDTIGAFVVDLGAAGEPIYPAQWTQGKSGSEVMWCYADNAQEDFRVKMAEKYVTIAAANAAWGTAYASFDELNVPKPGEARGQLWADVIDWYINTKRTVIEGQIQVYRKILEEFGLTEVQLVLYMPGTYYSEQELANCIERGTVVNGICLGADNEFMVQMADKYDCLLQYTGATDTYGVKLIRKYMYENGYEDIPVFAENAGDLSNASLISEMSELIMETYMAGIDYTNVSFLYDGTVKKTTDLHGKLEDAIPLLSRFWKKTDLTETAPFLTGDTAEAAPEGEVLKMEITVNKSESDNLCFVFVNLPAINFTIEEGDKLEYDVYLAESMHGVGGLDANFTDGSTIRDTDGIADAKGRRHPNADLSGDAYGTWYHRVLSVGISTVAGKTIRELLLAAHPEVKLYGDYENGTYTVYYDNIVITRGGEVVLTVFGGDTTVNPSACNTSISQKASAAVSIVDVEDVK